MALVLANRVQESATANTTVSFTLTGAVTGFQTFAVIGDTNTTYYSATDTAGQWEVGLGTYSTTGPTLTRTTIYASSNSGSAVTFSGTVSVFVTYPSGKSVNLDGTGNVSALGTVASGTWQGSTIGVAYGGTGVTSSSGANSVMLRDANQNVAVNRLNQSNTDTTASAGTTALTAASSYSQTLTGTGSHTFTMPDATTLTTGVAFVFNNNATGTLTLQDYATGAIGTITSGGAAELVLLANGTVAGTWDVHGFLPENVTWGTNSLYLNSTIVTGGTWQGGTIQPAYGGTGLTTFVGANNALYSTGASTLTAGTLPVLAGGTGSTTASGALTNLGAVNIAGDTMTGKLNLPAVTTSSAPLNLGDGATTTSPTSPVDGDIWINDTDGLKFRYNGVSRTAPRLEGTNTFSGSNSFTGGTFTLGSSAGTLPITLGRSAVSQTTNIQAASTGSGETKTINFGTGGLSGSITTITIGASLSGATTTVAGYGDWTLAGPISASAVTASNGIFVNNATVTASYTVASGNNASSAGPLVVGSGVTVTVSSGGRWVIV